MGQIVHIIILLYFFIVAVAVAVVVLSVDLSLRANSVRIAKTMPAVIFVGTVCIYWILLPVPNCS